MLHKRIHQVEAIICSLHLLTLYCEMNKESQCNSKIMIKYDKSCTPRGPQQHCQNIKAVGALGGKGQPQAA